ncbi:MAG: lipocalin family protein [Bacteroidia bacterium]
MKKLLLALLLVLNVFIFSSCEKEPVQQNTARTQMKETISSKKWKLVSSEMVLPGGNQPKEIEPCRLDNIWEYKKDGTFALYVGQELCSQTDKTMFGTWDLSADTKQIEYNITGIGSYADEVVEISSDKMVVKYTTDNVFTETYMPL